MKKNVWYTISMNSVGYFEIQADDPKRATEFYTAVFEWEFIKDEVQPIDYWQIKNAGINGGLLKRPAKRPDSEQGTNAFVCSVQVEDFDKTAKIILDHGGIV